MKNLLLLFLLLFTAAQQVAAQTFKLSDKTFKSGNIYVIEHIYFDLGKWDIRPESYAELNRIVEFLNTNKHLSIEVDSHSDTRASDMYSICITCKRAQSIVDYFISKGIDADRLMAKGYGETVPRIIYKDTLFMKEGDCITDAYIARFLKTEEEKEQAYQMNRRIELKILKVEPRYFKLTDTVFNVGDVFIADKIYFDFDKWTIRDESKNQIDSIISFLNKNQRLMIEVTGWESDYSNDKYSYRVMLKRAEEIKKTLIKNDIKRNRLKINVFSQRLNKHPLANLPSFNEDLKERHIELKILKTE